MRESSVSRIKKLKPEIIRPERKVLEKPEPSSEYEKHEELSKRLKSLALKKQLAVRRGRSEKQEILDQIQSTQCRLKEYKEAHSEHIRSVGAAQKSKESAYRGTLQAFEECITPLDARVSELQQSKQDLLSEKDKKLERLSELENAMGMCCEELEHRKTRRAEFIAQREESEETLEHMKLSYPEEFQNIDDWDLRSNLRKIREEKEDLISLIHNLEDEAKHTQDTLKLNNIRIQALLVETIELPSRKNVEEIEKLEVYLQNKAFEHRVSNLDEVIFNTFKEESCDLDEEILKIQFSKVDSLLKNMQSEWNTTELKLRNDLKISTDCHNWDDMERIEDLLLMKFREFKVKNIAILQWLHTVKNSIANAVPKPLPKITDNKIDEKFRKALLVEIDNQETQKSLKHMMNVYLQKIKQRESNLKPQTQVLIQIMKNKQDLIHRNMSLDKENRDLIHKLSSINDKETEVLSKIARPHIDEEIAKGGIELQENINYWNELIKHETHLISSYVKPTYKSLKLAITSRNTEIRRIKDSLFLLDNEHKSVQAQLDKLLETRTESLLKTLEVTEQPSSSLNRDIQLAEEDLINLTLILKSQEQKSSEELSRIEQEEAGIRMQQLAIILPVQKKADEDLSPIVPKNLDKLRELFMPSEMYKKFSQRNYLKHEVFDPLKDTPPELCGYGLRHVALSENLKRIEIKSNGKIDASIPIKTVIAPTIPEKTMNIIKAQKKEMLEEMMRSYYPFSILLEEDGRVDLIAKSYVVLKVWVRGLNLLLKYKKNLSKVRKILEYD